ncbi:MAG: zinc-binding dehydrogenase, partial [Proteobacteria bacterium]|nr:zinc-binding dehydrogenase [Pseudomonadota bacterium]
MSAIVLTGHGGLDKLVYRQDFPVPNPRPGEVLIEVTACGLNNTDVWVRQGAYGTDENPKAVASWRRTAAEETLTFPRIQGADSVGKIVGVGAGVSAQRLGERVMVDFSIYNDDGDSLANIDYIGHGRDGGFAEYVVVPEENAYLVSNDLTDAELATFCCAYLTGEHMLDRAQVEAGERVLISGASGGVGSGLIQLCRARGAIPYALTSEAKLEAVKALGAEAAINRESPNLVEAVNQQLAGKSVDVVADLVGGQLFNLMLQVLRPEGRYTTAGAIGGAIVQLDLRTIYLKHLAIHGSSQGTRGAFQ